MTSATLITRRVIEALNRAGIPHMLVGAFSRNAYAPPRSTYDADIVVALAGQPLRPVVEMLGAEFSLQSQPGFETTTGTIRDTLVHADAQFSVELFHLSRDDHDRERFARRLATKFDGEPTYIPTAEDVIITKLRWARRKDLDDVRDMLRFVEPASLDGEYLDRWVRAHGTRATLDTLLAEAAASER